MNTKYEILVVTNSNQQFTTIVDEKSLAKFYKDREIDFNKNVILDTEDKINDPVFIINGKYIESITLRKLEEESE